MLGTAMISRHSPAGIAPGRYDGVASVSLMVKWLLFPPLSPRKRCGSAMPRSRVARWSLAGVVKVDADAVYAGRHRERDVKVGLVLRTLDVACEHQICGFPAEQRPQGASAKRRTKHRLQRFMMSKPAPQPNSSEMSRFVPQHCVVARWAPLVASPRIRSLLGEQIASPVDHPTTK